MEDSGHAPVMVEEVLALLRPGPGRAVLECTVGRGGHAAAIMPRLAPGGLYIGLDADPGNIQHLRQAFAQPPVSLDLLHRNFADAPAALAELGVEGVDGLLADLGFASTQVDDAARGLSFSREGPLDMRLDPTQGRSAAELVNHLPQRELADLIYLYGEERFSRRIARKIVDARRDKPIESTGELASLCARAYGPGRRRSRIDPATRTFQALRIAVNDELGRLEALLDSLPDLLRPGGRAAIISFHSLEDRRVKHAFRGLVQAGRAEALTKKPLIPGEAERSANPRSRSAKLRGIRWKD